MSMNRLVVFLMALVPLQSIGAQETGTIAGIVTDQIVGGPLAAVRVTIVGTRYGATYVPAGPAHRLCGRTARERRRGGSGHRQREPSAAAAGGGAESGGRGGVWHAGQGDPHGGGQCRYRRGHSR